MGGNVSDSDVHRTQLRLVQGPQQNSEFPRVQKDMLHKYCWWFRNSDEKTTWDVNKNPCKSWDIHYQPQLVNSGFLKHQQYGWNYDGSMGISVSLGLANPPGFKNGVVQFNRFFAGIESISDTAILDNSG